MYNCFTSWLSTCLWNGTVLHYWRLAIPRSGYVTILEQKKNYDWSFLVFSPRKLYELLISKLRVSMLQSPNFEVWNSCQHASNDIFCRKFGHNVPRALQKNNLPYEVKVTSPAPPTPLQIKVHRKSYIEEYHLPISVKFCNLFDLISRSRINSPMFWSKPKKGWGVRNDKTNRNNNV